MSETQSRAALLATTANIPNDPPQRHQIDSRADAIAEQGPGDPDDLLTTRQMCVWFGLSQQWFEIGRHKGYGPPFRRLAPQVIRYRRGDVLAWLDERLHKSTEDYQ